MIKFALKIFNLNSRSLQIRSKQGTSSTSTKQRGTRFELSEFQFGTLKLTCNFRVHGSQIYIVNHDYSAVIIWFDTHIIVHGSKRRNLRKIIFQLKIQLFVLSKNLIKQLVLVAKGILKLNDSQERPLGIDHHLYRSQSQRCGVKTCP
jgi:hypothetical protein